MVLVDTSAWIHFLRPKGDAGVRAQVEAALVGGTASWCEMVRLELWNGAGDRERRILREFDRDLPDLTITSAIWARAIALARKCRDAGVTVPATDLVVAACARHYQARLIHVDADFDRLEQIED